MILHLLDDSHFADYAIRQFSGLNMKSELVVVNSTKTLKYVKFYDPKSTIVPNTRQFQQLLSRLCTYKCIMFHGLFQSWMEPVIKSIPSGVKVAWVFWGGEIYGRSDLQFAFISPISKFLQWIHFFRVHISNWQSENEIPLECFKRVDYCLCDVAEEEPFLKKYIGKNYQMRWYNYYSVEETIGEELIKLKCVGSNLMIGNSCSVDGNHVDILLRLKVLGFDKGNIIVPLSYGAPWFRNVVCKIGRILFKKRFCPLTEYLPRDEYNTLIASCSVVIMNHWRQQAFGNIMTALWLGSRVYMSKRSPLYTYFKRIGCILYSVEDDLTIKKVNWKQLTDEEREQNRKAIYAEYNVETMHQRNLELVKELNA